MTFENRMILAEHYLGLDKKHQKMQKNLAVYVEEFQAWKKIKPKTDAGKSVEKAAEKAAAEKKEDPQKEEAK